MSQKIMVTADSTCDLSRGVAERFGIQIFPLHVVFPNGDYRDGIDIGSEKVYEIVGATGVLPKTSAINTQEYIDYVTPYIEQGYEVIHINLGSGLSSCYQNALMAADELEGFHPVDSASLSTGSGLLVLAIKEMADEGRSVEEILAAVPELREKCKASFVIDTLEYLYKGGRCSALAMFGANLLNLKPGIEVSTEDGSMGVGKKYRGPLDKALVAYVRDKLAGRDDIDTRRVFITHSPIAPEMAELVRGEIEKYIHFDEVIETDAGCTISSHCVPGTLGILFMTK